MPDAFQPYEVAIALGAKVSTIPNLSHGFYLMA